MTERVYIIDDDPALRESLRLALESAGLAAETHESAESFLRRHYGGEAACMLVDLRLPGMGGLELLKEMRSQRRTMPVLMISAHGTISAAVQAMRLGADDFLEKPVDPNLLVELARNLLQQERTRRAREAQLESTRARLASLTQRERELLGALVMGKSSKQIAGELRLSVKTVTNHRAHLLAKTGAGNTADLVRMAVMAGSY